MGEQYFEILEPAHWTNPVVFNSPHSGSFLPPDFLKQSKLTPERLRQSEDCFVDELFCNGPGLGAPMLRALVSRSYIDLNREPFELDPRMYLEPLPGHMNLGSPRVASGLGTIPRLVAEGEEIYRGRINLVEAIDRINTVYRPYHRTLNSLLNECYNATGFVLLLDCHSMPSSAVRSNLAPQTDIVLGDRFGSACGSELAQFLEDQFIAKGFSVTRNRPYAGGFITETHGAPRLNRHAVQIELNRGLYMDEQKLIKNSNFGEIQSRLNAVSRELMAFLQNEFVANQQKIAAE
jgi:N-formylglutamate amidohydrolase